MKYFKIVLEYRKLDNMVKSKNKNYKHPKHRNMSKTSYVSALTTADAYTLSKKLIPNSRATLIQPITYDEYMVGISLKYKNTKPK